MIDSTETQLLNIIMNMIFFFHFQVRHNFMNRKSSKNVKHVDFAIKSYAVSILTGSTFYWLSGLSIVQRQKCAIFITLCKDLPTLLPCLTMLDRVVLNGLQKQQMKLIRLRKNFFSQKLPLTKHDCTCLCLHVHSAAQA